MAHSLLIRILTLALIQGASSSQQAMPPSGGACVSQDFPNQHAQQFPTLVSGNLNGTTLIVPISLKTAREMIPAEYGIVEAAYRELLPAFPEGMYPMMAQIVHDHDIQLPAYNASLPDFSDIPRSLLAKRASLEFPFIDIFGDGHTSYRWAGTSLMSASNPLAIEGAQGYGMTVHPAAFDPACDAYKALSPSAPATYAHARSSNSSFFMTLETRPSWDQVPYPLEFMRNVTNQLTFATTQACDAYRRLFDASLTPPVPVVGSVSADIAPLPGPRSWSEVYGWRLATPFLEPPVPSDCRPAAAA
ncbi:hypothetical protein AAE478_004962 [Parahypoxylon ruwenzoriense]